MEDKYQDALDTLVNVPTGDGFVGDYIKYRKAINDLQELVWKSKPAMPRVDMNASGFCYEYCCSACGHDLCAVNSEDRPKYCPNCGARIDWGMEENKHGE